MFRKVKEFMFSTLVGGVLVLVPLALLVYLVNELFKLVISVTDPVAQLLPEGSILRAPLGVELLLLSALVALAFVSGLVLRVSVRSRAGAWVEKVLLRNLPGYQVLKLMTKGLSDGEGGKESHPALIVSPGGYRQLGVVVEDKGGEEVTVFLPTTPTGMVGLVGRVGRDRVEILDAGLAQTSGVLANWGVGLQELTRRSPQKEQP